MKHYTELVDEAVGFSMYKHRTLRTCFDPGSHEWTEATIEKKVEILSKLVSKGHSLQRIIHDYKVFYREMNKTHVANNVEDGLTEILEYLLTDQGSR